MGKGDKSRKMRQIESQNKKKAREKRAREAATSKRSGRKR